MRTPNSIRGKMTDHFEPLGTADREMVERRAREIAIINGRPADQFNKCDFEQARRELAGLRKASPDSDAGPAADLTTWEQHIDSAAHQVPSESPNDEQTVAEELI